MAIVTRCIKVLSVVGIALSNFLGVVWEFNRYCDVAIISSIKINSTTQNSILMITIHELRTRLGFGTEQIAIFIGELYFMLPFTSPVKHLIPFPGMEMH
jgi:hypothetical protein